MIKLSALLLSSLFISFSSLAQDYVVKWGALEKRSGQLISVLPKGGSDFYTLRWAGGALLGSYKISEHSNLTVTATGKLVMKVEDGIGNFEGARNVGGKLIVFISDKKDGKNNLFIQEYSKDLLPQGSVKALASFDLEKNKSRGFFDVINSRNNDFFGVIWEIPGKKEEKDKYGFKIFDNDMNEISEGDYKMPFEGNLSSIHQHYLSNTGDYFISVIEYSEGDKKLFRKYLNYKAMHIFHINPDGIEEFTLSLEGKRVEALTMNSDNERIMTLTGIYGDQGKAGVSGLFYMRADFDKQEVIDEGFEKFGKDFITQDWSDRDKEKAEKRENKGKGEPQLYDYVMRQAEVLKDGSIVGSIEQYYVVVNTYTDPRTGSTRTTYTYYYNDIIAFKVNTDGEFDWLKRINKSQISTNDGGPYSSYARFVDNGKICFIFNDNVRNYDESGKFIGKENGDVYIANYGKKKNVVAIVELDIDEGELTRKTFFDRQEISALAVPKQFYIDYNTKEMLVYAVYGKKEKFGILKFND
jgi:hypothetical protein